MKVVEGSHPFRRFKEALMEYLGEGERWFAFEAARLRRRVLDRPAEEGIEPIFEGDA